MSRVLIKLAEKTKKMKKRRRFNKNIRTITKFFRLKTIFRAWKLNCLNKATIMRSFAGNQNKGKLTYCVKYTDFCRCEACIYERERMANIVPYPLAESELVQFENADIQRSFEGDVLN